MEDEYEDFIADPTHKSLQTPASQVQKLRGLAKLVSIVFMTKI